MQTRELQGQPSNNAPTVLFNAFLDGGPADIPQQQRRVQVNMDSPDNVVIQKGNGYEHFRPTGGFCEVDGLRVALLRWDYCTKIAE